ncbi:3'-5' exonuclease [Thiomonas sp.]
MDTYFLDTETTGLSPKTDRIVEIAIVDERGGIVLDTLVNPRKHIPKVATDVHGITNAMVKNAPTLAELWPRIREWLTGHRVVAYNVAYDRKFFPGALDCAAEVSCAMHRFTRYRHEHCNPGKLPYRVQNLDKAVAIIGHQWTGDAHRALADTLACRAVWNWVEQQEVPGINIYSGAPGLGGALTNMTELARQKGAIKKAYPVRFQGVVYLDAEAAYQGRKGPDPQQNEGLLIQIIHAKLRQHPKLQQAITQRGGERFLRNCAHRTGAQAPGKQHWEGDGMESRFIRCLLAGYQRSCAAGVQPGLFEDSA